jgi:PTH1 family peptidyl-tRNA hydrolase
MNGHTFRLLLGLGNPGREYSDTRHNIGFMILDRLAQKANVAFSPEKKWRAELASAGQTLLCKPQTFMNLSGECAGHISRFYKITPQEMLVILDDMALPLGKLRFRTGGSAGGHNGLQSIIDHLGTSAVPRLRVGIGSAKPGQSVDHVLGRFHPDETRDLDAILARSAEAVEYAQTSGLQAAMNLYHSYPPGSPAASDQTEAPDRTKQDSK